MYKFILAALLLAATGRSFAQSNYVPGIIQLAAGDSITGEIDYRDWSRSPKTINFKAPGGHVQVYDAAALAGFYIINNNERYISRVTTIDMTPDDPDKILRERITTPITIHTSIFMLQMVKGLMLSLYEYTDNENKTHFFYTDRSDSLVELIHHYLYVEGAVGLFHNTRYQQQVAEIIAACPTLDGKTRNLKYRESEIQELLVRYLNCSGTAASIIVKKKDRLPVQFGFVAGIMLNTYRLVNDIGWAEKGYKSDISPVAGISVDFGLSRHSDKLHILTELVYKRYKTSNSYSGTNLNGYAYQSALKFNFSYIQLNTVFRYVFAVSSRLRPFLEGGVQNATIIREKENTLYTKYSFGTETNQVAIENPRKYEISLPAGAGFLFRNLAMDLRYSYSPKSFSSSRGLDVITQSLHVLMTYRF